MYLGTKAAVCMRVDDCSKINSGVGQWEETLAVALPEEGAGIHGPRAGEPETNTSGSDAEAG